MIRKRKRNGKNKICPICKKEFYVKPSHLKLRNTCSRKCYSKLLTGRKLSKETKRKLSLANGGNGIPIKRPKYHHSVTKRYKKWRMEVFTRDGFKCQICDKTGKCLVPHHIKGWAKYQKLRYEVSNGITLCVECHKEVHKLFRKKY